MLPSHTSRFITLAVTHAHNPPQPAHAPRRQQHGAADSCHRQPTLVVTCTMPSSILQCLECPSSLHLVLPHIVSCSVALWPLCYMWRGILPGICLYHPPHPYLCNFSLPCSVFVHYRHCLPLPVHIPATALPLLLGLQWILGAWKINVIMAWRHVASCLRLSHHGGKSIVM